jgi:hypothetical protein
VKKTLFLFTLFFFVSLEISFGAAAESLTLETPENLISQEEASVQFEVFKNALLADHGKPACLNRYPLALIKDGNLVVRILTTAIESMKRVLSVKGISDKNLDQIASGGLSHARVLPTRTSSWKYVVTGDIHGAGESLAANYEKQEVMGLVLNGGCPETETTTIFTGDFSERGFYGLECWMLALLSMIQNPEEVVLCRGNHEQLSVVGNFIIYEETCLWLEVKRKYPDQFQAISRNLLTIFNLMPQTIIFGNPGQRIMVTHGAIPTDVFGAADLPKGLVDFLITGKFGIVTIPEDFGWAWHEWKPGRGICKSLRGGQARVIGFEEALPILQKCGVFQVLSGHTHLRGQLPAEFVGLSPELDTDSIFTLDCARTPIILTSMFSREYKGFPSGFVVVGITNNDESKETECTLRVYDTSLGALSSHKSAKKVLVVAPDSL